MTDQNPADSLDQLARDLATSDVPAVRRQAALRLGRAHELDVAAVRSLVVSSLFDPEITVRHAAAAALDLPAAQEILGRNPTLKQEAIQSAVRERPYRQGISGQAIQTEFEHRRRNELFFLYVALAALVVLTILIYSGNAELGPLAFVLWSGVVVSAAIYTWANWRCPACGASLFARAPRVDPWSTRTPFSCPHCATRLR